MKNEKGITLIELLISVVIAGIVIVPLLLIMSGSFTRTVEQGEDTQLTYYGQQIMEMIRETGYTEGDPGDYYCAEDQGCTTKVISNPDAKVKLSASLLEDDSLSNEYYEITVQVTPPPDYVKPKVTLVTVVKK